MLKKALELLHMQVMSLITKQGKTPSDTVVTATVSVVSLIAVQAVADKVLREEVLSEENRMLLKGCKTLTNAALDTVDPKMKEVNIWTIK